MKLTKRIALTESIKIWKKLAETGKSKDWYDRYVEPIYTLYGHGCPLCEIFNSDCQDTLVCDGCPLSVDVFDGCENPKQPYGKWIKTNRIEKRKEHASELLMMLRKALRKLNDRKKPKKKPLGRSPSRKTRRQPSKSVKKRRPQRKRLPYGRKK